MLYLHLSNYEGKTILAVVSEEPFIVDGLHEVVDVEIVESRGEAHDWYVRKIKERESDGQNDTLHERQASGSDYNIVWT
jgi:hypothetical protein